MSRIIEQILLKLKQFLAAETEMQPFFKTRFRWWTPFDIEWFAREFGGKYNVEFRSAHVEEGRIEIFDKSRREIRVKADTLYAFLMAYRAVLFQKEVAPFTERDRALEEFVSDRYPHMRDTPFL